MRSLPGRPTAKPSPDVVIVGGGVIGCSIAYHLTLAGSSVRLIERDRLASGASGVAAGMLAPQVEAHYDDPFFDLCLRGRDEHVELAEALMDSAGLDVERRTTGVFRLALDEAERVELRRQMQWQVKRGLRAKWFEPSELGALEPLLNGAAGRLLAGGLWFPDEAQVHSPRLIAALAAASVKRGADLSEGTWATEILVEGNRAIGVRTPAGIVEAESVVLAAGVWSTDLARAAGVEVPVTPVKGQVITLRALGRSPTRILWTGECYLVPKTGGQVILGATEEEGNYDRRPTLAGVGALATAALEQLPWAGQFNIEGVWAGLRPAAPDRYPIVGWAPGLDNLLVATAHFRNGVLLGPLTGRRVSEAIRTGVIASELAPFGLERFQAQVPRVSV